MAKDLYLNNIHHSYPSKHVLYGLNIHVQAGHIACLLGYSGCGKTTALRLIAGFETPTQGEIILGDRSLSTPKYQLRPHERRMGMVFQDYALFPHLDVQGNVSFGINHLNKSEQYTRVSELMELIDLKGLEKRYPHELSGGQQQRVALARALAPKPELLLLDEPFSSLDVNLRAKLSREVRDILKHEGITALMVTHDQHEAFAMADEIGVMMEGQMVQWDDAYNLYHCPKNRTVAEFIGESAFIMGVISSHNSINCALGQIHGSIPDCFKQGDSVHMMLRPDDLIHQDNSELKLRVEKKYFRGENFQYVLRLPNSNELVLALVPSHHNHAVGEFIGFTLELDHMIIFHDDHSHRIEIQS
jgi:iron(III) transport system ATP-binding protein